MNQTLITQGLTIEELLANVREIVRTEIKTIPQPEKVKEYLSLQEACQLTGFSKSLIYQLTSTRRIPHLKRGGKLLFNRQELTTWLNASTQPVEKY